MPPSPKAPPVDAALCERVCRVSRSLGWSLEEHQDAQGWFYLFTSANGRQVGGEPHTEKAAALTYACRLLAEHLV